MFLPGLTRAGLAIAIFFCFACAQEKTVIEEFDFEKSKEFLASNCEENKFSGIVIVLSKGEEAFAHSCTVADADPITRETRFKIFSTSKHFTAALIMALTEEERLSLDDPITRWIPEAPQSWGAISVRDLLLHQSGLPDLTQGLLDLYKGGARDHSAAVAALVSNSQQVAPDADAKWRYNNFGYELLVLAAESAGEARFETLLQEHIFDPAGMGNALVEQVSEDEATLAAAADPDLVQGFNGSPTELEEAFSYSFVQRGAGGLHASAADFVAYYQSLREYSVLSRDLQNQMVAEAVQVNENVSNGIGWFVRPRHAVETLGHSGGNNGYVSQFTYIPDVDAAVIVLSNYGFAPLRDVHSSLLDDLLKPGEVME